MKLRNTLIAALILQGHVLNAATLKVPMQYSTIQSAINAAVPGDTVLVEPNTTYYENIDFIGKDITVRTPNPVNDRHTTIIDGGLNGSVVKFINQETNNAKIEGFTVTNGTGTIRNWSYYMGFPPVVAGGGIICDSPHAFTSNPSVVGSSPTISNMIIANNTAEYGGGVSVWLHSFPIIENTIITDNNSTVAGGGLACYENFSTIGTVVLRNVEISRNITGGLGGGGVIANYSSRVSMMNCTVVDNVSLSGYGEVLFRANGSNFEIYNSILWGFTSDILYDQGGVPVLSSIDYSDAENIYGITNVGPATLSINPLFVNASNNNYRLSPGSLCINAGTTVNAPLNDLDGNPRNGNPDLGAYESETTGINETSGNSISLYPNPVQDKIYLDADENLDIRITNASGQLMDCQINQQPGKKVINVSGMAQGVYFIDCGNNSHTKFIKL